MTINADGTWSYDEDTVLHVEGRDEPFHHTDVHTLHKVGEPTPNPLARRLTRHARQWRSEYRARAASTSCAAAPAPSQPRVSVCLSGSSFL